MSHDRVLIRGGELVWEHALRRSLGFGVGLELVGSEEGLQPYGYLSPTFSHREGSRSWTRGAAAGIGIRFGQRTRWFGELSLRGHGTSFDPALAALTLGTKL